MLNYFLPNKYKLRPEKVRKSRITVFIHLLCGVAMLIYWLFLLGDKPKNSTVLLIGLGLIPCSLFLFKKYGSFFLSGNILTLIAFLFLSSTIFVTGYLYSLQLPWLLVVPLLSFFLAGRSSGLFWTILFLGVIAYCYWQEINAEVSYFKASEILESDYYFNSFLFLSIVIVSFLFIFEFESDILLRHLRKNRTILKEQNLLLEAKVKERTQSLSKSNEHLKRSNNDLEQFAYVASHDLQEPLRMVGNFVELIEEEYKDKLDENGKMYIQYSVAGVARMSRLIEELLEYSRVGRRGDAPTTVDFNKLVKNKLRDLTYSIEKKNVQFEIGELPANIRCIPVQINTLLQNLISNGIKFNESNPPIITIQAEERKSEWVFSVADNGIGIEEEYAGRIFEVFKRLHRKEEYSGTGIGLAICKKVVEYHNGKIWLESEYGKGTTFYFSISKYLD